MAENHTSLIRHRDASRRITLHKYTTDCLRILRVRAGRANTLAGSMRLLICGLRVRFPPGSPLTSSEQAVCRARCLEGRLSSGFHTSFIRQGTQAGLGTREDAPGTTNGSRDGAQAGVHCRAVTEKRRPGRPRIHAETLLINVTLGLRPEVLDAACRRADSRGTSVAAVLRGDLELVDTWRQRKAASTKG